MRESTRFLALFAFLLAGCASVTPKPAAGSYRAMAYNVLYDGADDEASLSTIADEDPDVLCLRELTPKFARAFERRFAATYPHRVLKPKGGTWGAGVASRYPIEASASFPQLPHRIPGLAATVRIHGRRLRFVCVHLMPPVAKHRGSDSLWTTIEKNQALRIEQAGQHLARLASERGPLLLLGDFNEGRRQGALQLLEAGALRHACDGPEAACGATFPGATYVAPAIFEIDHILGRGVSFENARRIAGGGSDHFPVCADFRFDP